MTWWGAESSFASLCRDLANIIVLYSVEGEVGEFSVPGIDRDVDHKPGDTHTSARLIVNMWKKHF